MTEVLAPHAAQSDLSFSRELRIEWGDCDPAGIVFYPRYLAFFDANTGYLFEAAGLPKSELTKRYEIIGMPLVDVQAKFWAPSRYGDAVTITSRIAEWRRSSMLIEHRLLRESQLAVEARETRVWAAHDPQRPGGLKVKPIPADVMERFSKAAS